MSHSFSSYLRTIFEPQIQNQVVQQCCNIIKKDFAKAKYIVVRGTSGLVIGSIVANKLGLRLVVVRKNESMHSECKIEGMPLRAIMPFVILDDFVDSGDTLSEIAKELRKSAIHRLSKLRCEGYLMYLQASKPPESKLPFKGKKFQGFAL